MAMLWPSLLGYFTWNLIKDPWHDVVVCGIPKNGIISLRTLLNGRCDNSTACLPCRCDRCAEFKFNRRWNLRDQRLVVLFRDPFARMLSAYNDMPTNPWIRTHMPHGWAGMTFADFVDHAHARWDETVKDEHFTPQTTLCQPDQQTYHFVGLNENHSHVQHVYRDLLGATRVLRLHEANRTATRARANCTKIRQMYRADYEFLHRRWPTRTTGCPGG